MKKPKAAPAEIVDNDPLGVGNTVDIDGDGLAATDVEAREAVNIESAAESFEFDDPFFAAGDCRDAMLTVIKQAVDWSKMKEHAQRDIIAAASNAATTIVQKIARAIASAGCPQVGGFTLDQITIKDGLKITLKGPLTHESLALGEQTGKQVLLSLPDAARFDNARKAAEYSPDQADAFPEDSSDLSMTRDEAGNLESVDVGIASNRQVVREGETLKVVHKDTGADLGEPTTAERAAFEFAEDNPGVERPAPMFDDEAETQDQDQDES